MVDRPENPRARIIAAASQVLAADGTDGFTTRRIAAAAGVNPGLVHYHCGSIDALREAVAERHYATTLEHRRTALLAAGPFLDRWHQTLAVLDAESAHAARIDAELRACAANHPPIRAQVAAFAQGWLEALHVALVSAAEEYGLSPGLATPLAELLSGFTTGMVADRAAGLDTIHAAALEWFDAMVLSLRAEREP